MVVARRSFLGGMFAAFAAPAIVSYKSIMPVKLVRWVEEYPYSRGTHTFESYPWVATINYDEQDSAHINLGEIDVKCMYVPSSYDPARDARLDDGFVQGPPVKRRGAWRPDWEDAAEIMKLEDLDEVNRSTYNWVKMTDMRYAKPKVIK